MGFFFVVLLIIWAAVYLNQTYIGKVVWCEKCNTWQQMKMRTGAITGWDCPSCNWLNQFKFGACPSCGWYGKYQNGFISRRGPFQKVDRTPITPFYGVQEVYWAYEEKIKCPKHGVFIIYPQADFNQQYQQDDDYEDIGY